MKRLLYLLLLITSIGFGQAGRQWEGNGKPVTKPTGFTKSDTYRDTVNKITYKYDTKWYITTDQREGDTGSQGIPGIPGLKGDKGDAGVCPDCPPSGGGGTTPTFSFGVKWVGTMAEFTQATADVKTRAIYINNSFTASQRWTIAPNYSNIFLIVGNGNNITVSCDTFIYRKYNSLSEANAGIDMQLRIDNLSFTGNGNNVCVFIEANYGAKYSGCRFSNFKTALDLRWCMETKIDQCFFWENYIGINLDYARFSGGSNSASQSNHSTVIDCKFRSSSNHFAAIKATAVSGLVIDHCIFEGVQAGPQYEVYFDDAGSTVVKDFTMRNCHIEQQQSVAGVYIRLNDGFAYVSSVFSQYDCNLIKFESTGYAKCIVQGIPYLTSGTKFENVNSAGRWEFIDMPATFDPLIATNWKTSVPYQPAINGWQTSGQTKYLKGITVK